MGEETRALVASAKEKMKHTNIILDDMMKNRREYSSKDLSWRNLDLLKAAVLSMDEILLAFDSVVERVMPTSLENGESETQENSEDEEVAEDIFEEDEQKKLNFEEEEEFDDEEEEEYIGDDEEDEEDEYEEDEGQEDE